jgi:nicotinamidase-related amidase
MHQITLSARQAEKHIVTNLQPDRTAFLLVDCTDNQRGSRAEIIRTTISPALQAARRAGMRPIYLFESGHGTGGPADVLRDLAGATLRPGGWQPTQPIFDPSIAPRPDEPVLGKWHYDGFVEGHIDYYLRTWQIDTVIAVGFRLPCCLFQTCLGARTHNYRVILLRDCTCPPGALESVNTRDTSNPEGGWMRYAFIRWFEELVGFTSTSADFIAACNTLAENHT